MLKNDKVKYLFCTYYRFIYVLRFCREKLSEINMVCCSILETVFGTDCNLIKILQTNKENYP